MIFEAELKKHSNDFVEWRYYIEKPGKYAMNPTFNIIFMENLKVLAKAEIEQALKKATAKLVRIK